MKERQVTSETSFPDAIRLRPLRKPASGSLSVPGSKSLGNRAIVLAGAARGTSRLGGVLDSDDTTAALRALRSLGVPCRRHGDAVEIDGAGLDFPAADAVVDIGASGTVGRFLPGILAAAPKGSWRLEAADQLAARPLGPLVESLRQWGARLEQPVPGKSFPLAVAAGGLEGGPATVSAAKSSQFASGLLMAAPLCRRRAAVTIRDLDPDETYIDMTLGLMRRFGVESRLSRRGSEAVVEVPAPAPYIAADMTIEADANTAGYFLALAAMTEGEVRVENLPSASGQPGLRFLAVLERLGATVVRGAGVAVRGGPLPLRGGFSIDMRAMSESALTLGVMAVLADKPVSMTNLAHIRGHESDRLAALCAILRRFGVAAEERPDSVTIHPSPMADIDAAVVNPLEDHRLAMAFSLLGAAANGATILNPGCVAKTCPTFFSMLQRLGVETAR